MIRLNLTGDYAIDESDGSRESELAHLNAFLGALRGSMKAESDPMLREIAHAAKTAKVQPGKSLILEISSELAANTLTHRFRLYED